MWVRVVYHEELHESFQRERIDVTIVSGVSEMRQEMAFTVGLISPKWSFFTGTRRVFLLLSCAYKLFCSIRNTDVAKEPELFLCCFSIESPDLGPRVTAVRCPRSAQLTPDGSSPALSAGAAPSFDAPILAGPCPACPGAPPSPGSSSSRCAGFASGGPSPRHDSRPEASCAPLSPF